MVIGRARSASQAFSRTSSCFIPLSKGSLADLRKWPTLLGLHTPMRLPAGVTQRSKYLLSRLQSTSSKFSLLVGDKEIVMRREWISHFLGYYFKPPMIRSIPNSHDTRDDGCDVGVSRTFFLGRVVVYMQAKHTWILPSTSTRFKSLESMV